MNKMLGGLAFNFALIVCTPASAENSYAEWRDWSNPRESTVLALASELESFPPAAGALSAGQSADTNGAYREWNGWSDPQSD